MPRPRTLAIGAFVLLLAVAPFIPRGGGEDGAILPSGEGGIEAIAADTAGLGSLTPTLRSEIDRVVGQGEALGRITAKQAPATLVSELVRCADFEGQRYCLHSGWTQETQGWVQARMSTAARGIAARGAVSEQTGDLDALATLRRTANLTPARRAVQERRELTMAARSVAKVWLLRHEIEGIALPDGFLAAHPEARIDVPVAAKPTKTPTPTASPSPSPSATPTRTPTRTPSATPSPTPTGIATSPAPGGSDSPVKTQADYPRRATVLDPQQVQDQQRTYWCGPTTMAMIAWGWKGEDLGQAHWAAKLGTTSSGSAITEMVRVVNQNTGWDRKSHAGPYITLDIGAYSFNQWMTLTMRHIVDYTAPIVLHPILLKKYYPYLDDDASGHFQAGRGYDKRGDRPTAISYFEPWNQQRFDPSEPYISRVQWRTAYKSFRANQAHFQHNIGV